MLRGEREPPSAKILPLPFSQVDQGVLQNIRVVLVNTSHPGNIGGAARAMKNMGLSRLVLVDPEEFPSPKALARASGANDLLDNAQVVSTLEEALVGCSLVLGTSARDRRIPWPLLDPRECASKSLEQVALGGEVALVFGREYAGLTNEELQRCQFHVHIPSDPEFGSLNLAAAVQVLTYEVRMAWLAAQARRPRWRRWKPRPSWILGRSPWTSWNVISNTSSRRWWKSASSIRRSRAI